jgi:hypothetical protein
MKIDKIDNIIHKGRENRAPLTWFHLHRLRTRKIIIHKGKQRTILPNFLHHKNQSSPLRRWPRPATNERLLKIGGCSALLHPTHPLIERWVGLQATRCGFGYKIGPALQGTCDVLAMSSPCRLLGFHRRWECHMASAFVDLFDMPPEWIKCVQRP